MPRPSPDVPRADEAEIRSRLAAFVSYPRTGSQWLNAVMELYFDRPCLRDWRATFLDPHRIDWLWFHDHDFDLTLKHNNVLYIYRDPVDTIYSYLCYRFASSRRKSWWGRLVQRNERAVTPEKVRVLSQEYRSHLEKWLLSSQRARTTVRYEALVARGEEEFAKVCAHFGQALSTKRLQEAFAKASKESMVNVAVKKVALSEQLLRADYRKEREQFRLNYESQIKELVLSESLRPFFAPVSGAR